MHLLRHPAPAFLGASFGLLLYPLSPALSLALFFVGIGTGAFLLGIGMETRQPASRQAPSRPPAARRSEEAPAATVAHGLRPSR